MKKKCDNKSQLLFTYIDRFGYENIHDDFGKNKEMFSFSNYSSKSKYYNDSNVLPVGKMEVEWTVKLLKNLLDQS